MTTDLGRPRDSRIDEAVLSTTVELLAETGYSALSVEAIARRAGTSKPAIYRRWPSKAHLVHEAVFPIGDSTELPNTGTLLGDVCEMLRRTAAVLNAPAARRALPGLIGEMSADPTLHVALLKRFDVILSRDLGQFLAAASARGEVRPDVTAADLADAVAGLTLVTLLTRGAGPAGETGAVDDAWIERTATLITKGIST